MGAQGYAVIYGTDGRGEEYLHWRRREDGLIPPHGEEGVLKMRSRTSESCKPELMSVLDKSEWEC